MTPSHIKKIDCDIHPGIPDMSVLLPFMSDYWREQFVTRGIDHMEIASYLPNSPLACRDDWREPGRKPASSLETVQRQALDGMGIDIAILNPLYGGQVSMSEQMGAAICSAVNDWIRVEWLDKEPRLRASIVVPAQNPRLAAEEIARCAGDKRFVQVLLLVANELTLGREYYWPIYEAAQRHGLPVGVHAGSMYRYPTTPSGWPTHQMQDYASMPQMFSAQLQSLISEGTMGKFPDLTFVLIESGVAWITPFMWRTTKTWRGLRGEVPWIKQPPIEIVRERVRMTLQPFDGPESAAEVEQFLAQVGNEDFLLYSSDYPHWHFDGNNPVPLGISQERAARMARDNPLKTYPRILESLQ